MVERHPVKMDYAGSSPACGAYGSSSGSRRVSKTLESGSIPGGPALDSIASKGSRVSATSHGDDM